MTTTSRRGPVVVVGAGVIGLCTAYYLRQSGADVVVVDRATVGSGASWGNAGWVCRSHSVPVPAPGVVAHVARNLGRPDSPLYLRPELSTAFARWMWHFLRSTSAARFETSAKALTVFAEPVFDQFAALEAAGVVTSLTRPGLVHAFLSEHEATRTLETQRRFAAGQFSVPSTPATGQQARALDPALGPDVSHGYTIEGEGVLNPEAFTASLAKTLTEQGVRLLEHTVVTGFRRRGDTLTGVEVADGEIECSGVVVAAGSWSADVVGRLGLQLPLQAGKGYSFSVALPKPPERPLYFGDKHIVASPVAGLTRLAGTMEFSGNNLQLNWHRIVSIARASRSYLGPWYDGPDELMARISHPWVGGRPMLPDGLPVIDRVPGHANAYISTGHAMLGVALSTASGRSLASFVLGGTRPTELQPFQMSRIRGIRKATQP